MASTSRLWAMKLLIAGGALILSPASAAGQALGPIWPTDSLKVGPDVATPNERQFEVFRAHPSGHVDAMHHASSERWQEHQHDSVWNGILIGAGLGVPATLALSASAVTQVGPTGLRRA